MGRVLLLFGVVMPASCDREPVFSPVRQLGAFELTHRNGGSLPQAVDDHGAYGRAVGNTDVQATELTVPVGYERGFV